LAVFVAAVQYFVHISDELRLVICVQVEEQPHIPSERAVLALSCRHVANAKRCRGTHPCAAREQNLL